MSDNHSAKNLEFSPILGVEKPCPEKFTFDINGSYVYQIGHSEQKFVSHLPLNWKIWFVPVYITSFLFLSYLTIGLVQPQNKYEVRVANIMSAISSLIIAIMVTVVDVAKLRQRTIDFWRNL